MRNQQVSRWKLTAYSRFFLFNFPNFIIRSVMAWECPGGGIWNFAYLYSAQAWRGFPPPAKYWIWLFYIPQWQYLKWDCSKKNNYYMTRILARLSLTCAFILLMPLARYSRPAKLYVCIFIFRMGAPEFFPVSEILDLALLYLAEAVSKCPPNEKHRI